MIYGRLRKEREMIILSHIAQQSNLTADLKQYLLAASSCPEAAAIAGAAVIVPSSHHRWEKKHHHFTRAPQGARDRYYT